MIEELIAVFFRALVSLAFGLFCIPLLTLGLYLNKEGKQRASVFMLLVTIGFMIMTVGVWLM